MPEQAATQPTTQPKLTGAFNDVSPKIVRVSDLYTLIKAHAQVDDLGTIGNWVADAELQAIGKKGGGKGLFTDGKFPTPDHVYVDSKFVKDGMAEVMKDPKLTGKQRELVAKVNQAINEALDGCPDHSADVKAGKLKPFAPKP